MSNKSKASQTADSVESLMPVLEAYLKRHSKFFAGMPAAVSLRMQSYQQMNSFRMGVALENFTQETKYALFEVLFFLHVNDRAFENYKYGIYGKDQNAPGQEETSCLYVPDCLVGIKGIEDLAPAIRNEFAEYCRRELRYDKLPRYKFSPIVSVCSIGSVGTIAHKSGKSDLDIQVQYELFPPSLPLKQLTKSLIKELLQHIKSRSQQFEKLRQEGSTDTIEQMLKRNFPMITIFLEQGSEYFMSDSPETDNNVHRLGLELENLYQASIISANKNQLIQSENLFQKKIMLLHEHLKKKFPSSEIFFFAYTTGNYRKGRHGNTKKSKEASGTAYELILNYEVLLPGIHWNQVSPSFVIFNSKINNNESMYTFLSSLLSSGAFPGIVQQVDRLVDLGHTPGLKREYIISHFGSVYWEAFKASQGNLPKAFLNLLRIETMLWKDESDTVIRAIMDRNLFNFSSELEKEDDDEFGLNIPENKLFTIKDIAEAENKFINLRVDPWWIRYKILKVAFEKAPGIIPLREAYNIQSFIDICFAIHIMLSEVITEEFSSSREEELNYRKSFLKFFYNNAFPPFSENRVRINKIFLGDVDTIHSFEKDLKVLFKNCIQRVEFSSKINSEKFAANREEFNIWHHYFKKYFNPPHNVIPRSLFKQRIKHGNRINVSYKDKQWQFSMVLSSKDAIQKSFILSEGSEKKGEVELFHHQQLLYGFGFCILNGYFIADLEGELQRTATSLEINADNFNEHQEKNTSKLSPESPQLMAKFLLRRFRPFPVDYRDCLKEHNPVKDACVFINVLIFGRVDIIYRDTLDNWIYWGATCDELQSKSRHIHSHPDEFFDSKELIDTINQFCSSVNFNKSLAASHMHLWVNPTSLMSQQQNIEKRIEDFEMRIKRIVFN